MYIQNLAHFQPSCTEKCAILTRWVSDLIALSAKIIRAPKLTWEQVYEILKENVVPLRRYEWCFVQRRIFIVKKFKSHLHKVDFAYVYFTV